MATKTCGVCGGEIRKRRTPGKDCVGDACAKRGYAHTKKGAKHTAVGPRETRLPVAATRRAAPTRAPKRG